MLRVFPRPGYFPSTEQGLRYTAVYQVIVGIINHHITILEQGKLLHTLVRHGIKVLLMGTTDIRQDTDGGTDDAMQRFHFAHFGYARFENAQLRPFVHQPYGQGNTNLGVVAPRRPGDNAFRTKELIKPFFHHGLAVAARDADDRHIKPGTILFGQALQAFQRMGQLQEIGIGIVFQILRQVADHKIADTPFVQFRDVFMSVIPFCLQGEEESFLGKTQRTAICQNPINFGRIRSYTIGIQYFFYIFNRDSHNSISFCTSKYGNFSLSRTIFNTIWDKNFR